MKQLLLALALALAGAPALAQSPPAPAPVMPSPVGPKVQVGLYLLHATRGTPAIDSRLEWMKASLTKLPFDAFSLLDQHVVTLTDGGNDTMKLAGGRTVVVKLVSHDAREARVQVQLSGPEGQVLDTTVSIHRNRMFFVAVGGYQGGSLIIPVSVKY